MLEKKYSILQRKILRFCLPIVFVLPLILFQSVLAAQIKLAWDPEPGVTGYNVYYGTASRLYGSPIDVGNTTTCVLTGLSPGQTYFISVTAYDEFNRESGYSNEVSGVAKEQALYTIATSPSGLQLTVDGSAYTGPQSFSWVPGSSHTLSVSSPQPGASGVRYVFASWSDGGGQNHTITAPSTSTTYTAYLATQYSLSTSVNLNAAGIVNPSGTNWYNSGESVSVSAAANSGYNLNNWSGDLSGSTDSSSITMNGPKSVMANFLSSKNISTPKTPKGPKKGTTGKTYMYSTGGSVSDPGAPVEYQFDWTGDGMDLSPWGSATQSKTWTSTSTHYVRARARYSSAPNVISDWSGAMTVTVTERPFIHVTSPNGGETYPVGTTHSVTWSSGSLNPNGILYLFYRYDQAWHPIAALPSTATSYDWTVPDIPSRLGTIVPRSRIRSTSIWIGHWANGSWECWGSSDRGFKILYDEWVFKVSNGDKGGVAIQFGESTFGGHGISFGRGMFEIEGTYSMNASGSMSGTYTLYDLNSTVLGSGSLIGEANNSSTKMTLTLNRPDGQPLFDMSGVRFFGEPVIPQDWKGNISGSAKGTLDPLKIEPYQIGDDVYSHVFKVSGSGFIPAFGATDMEGYFFLTNRYSYSSMGNITYGIYAINGTISETGVFSGSLNPTSGRFKFKAMSEDGKTYILSGQAGP